MAIAKKTHKALEAMKKYIIENGGEVALKDLIKYLKQFGLTHSNQVLLERADEYIPGLYEDLKGKTIGIAHYDQNGNWVTWTKDDSKN